MEYVQMTLDDWVQMKQKLKQELLGVKQSFVRIGYALRQIDDQKLYEQDGYKSIAEFAQAEYGLGPSITSRFMSINREYSIDGYSEQLRPEYAELGRSQLEEMLKLPDTDRQMIQPETSREDIRELKRFNKTEPAAGVQDTEKAVDEMLTFCLDPLAQMFMQEINRKRIGKNGIQKGTKLQIDTMRVKHIDMFDIATSADKLISSGIYTVNMILRALGEIPIDEGWADQHFITKNYSTIQEILEEQQKGGGKNAKTG